MNVVQTHVSVLIIKGTPQHVCVCVCIYANFLIRNYIIGNTNLAHFHTYREGTISSNLAHIAHNPSSYMLMKSNWNKYVSFLCGSCYIYLGF